jgi:hypothetical protein
MIRKKICQSRPRLGELNPFVVIQPFTFFKKMLFIIISIIFLVCAIVPSNYYLATFTLITLSMVFIIARRYFNRARLTFFEEEYDLDIYPEEYYMKVPKGRLNVSESKGK